MQETKFLPDLQEYANHNYRLLLEKIRWMNGFCCPRCSETRGYWIESRRLYQCKACSLQTSATSNTAFHGIRDLERFINTLFTFLEQKPLPATKIANRFNSRYSSSWMTMHRIRHTLSSRAPSEASSETVPCERFKEALTKSSSEPRPDFSHESEGKGSYLVIQFINFLLLCYRGISAKYVLNYAGEFSFRQIACRFSQVDLLELFIRGSPATASMIVGRSAPLTVPLAVSTGP